MKKLITLSLLCLTLTSCSGYSNDKSDTTTNNETNTSTNNETSNENNESNNETDSPTTEANDTNLTEDGVADVVTTPSITADSNEFVKSLSWNGNWITAALNDITLEEDLNVDGEFHDKNDQSKDIYRKLALYTQDADKNVTGTFTLTVPNMIVTSENFRIQEGVVKGNVTVKANGFELKNSTIEGDLTFESDEFKQSAKLEEGTVTGKIN